MPLQFPATCSYGHAPLHIPSLHEWFQHTGSAHTGVGSVVLARALAPDTTVTVNAVASAVSLSTLSRFGCTMDQVSSITAESLSGAHSISMSDFVTYTQLIGSRLSDPISISRPHLFLDFFMQHLDSAATDKVEGSVILRDSASKRKVQIAWSELIRNYDQVARGFEKSLTNRRIMHVLLPFYRAVWNLPAVTALNDVRQEGTARSRRVLGPNGKPFEAWVAVPGMDIRQLTPAEITARMIINDRARYNVAEGEVIHLGADSEGVRDDVALARATRSRDIVRATVDRQKATRASRAAVTASTSSPQP